MKLPPSLMFLQQAEAAAEKKNEIHIQIALIQKA